MPRGLDEWLAILAAWFAATAVLSWSRWPARARAAAGLLMSALGLVFVVVALRTEGVDEASSRAVYIAGPAYITDQASAAASQKYYILAGLCLMLGTTALAVNEAGARWLTRNWISVAIGYSLTVSGLRFLLERAAAPQPLSYAVGITWLAPLIGVFFAVNIRREGDGGLRLLRAVAIYGLATRAAVAALVAIATRLELGSHYDVSALTRVRSFLSGREYVFEPASWRQIVELAVVAPDPRLAPLHGAGGRPDGGPGPRLPPPQWRRRAASAGRIGGVETRARRARASHDRSLKSAV